MFEDNIGEGEEYFYDPECAKDYEPDFIMDDESGLTWAEVQTALKSLAEAKGHNGPFTFDEFYDSVCSVFLDPHLKSLMSKGLMEIVMERDGTIGYKLTQDGLKVAEEMLEEENV